MKLYFPYEKNTKALSISHKYNVLSPSLCHMESCVRDRWAQGKSRRCDTVKSHVFFLTLEARDRYRCSGTLLLLQTASST